jgi:hypothetical protein
MGITRCAWLFAFAAVFVGTDARAQRSIADCEKIADANAYNNCLASFGPRSRGGGARVVTPTGDAPVTEPTAVSPAPAGRAARRGTRGRVRAVLQPHGGAYLNVPARPGRVRIEIRRRR